MEKTLSPPQRVVNAVKSDLDKVKFADENLVVKFSKKEELEHFYKVAMSVALGVKKEILEWEM